MDALTEIRSSLKEASASVQEYLQSLESDPKAEDADLIVSTREQLQALEKRITSLAERGSQLMVELGGVRQRLAELRAEVERHTAETPLLKDEDIQREQEAISGVVSLFSQQLTLDTWRQILEMKLEECKGGARHLVPLMEEEIKRISAEDFEPGSEEYEITMQGLTKRLGNLINLDEAKMRFLVSSSHESIAKLRSERVGSIPKG